MRKPISRIHYFAQIVQRPVPISPQSTAKQRAFFRMLFGEEPFPQRTKAISLQLVGSETGLDGSDAMKREADVFAAAQLAADTARKAVAHSLLWTFVALLIGAFCSSLAATIGGGQRDRVVIV